MDEVKRLGRGNSVVIFSKTDCCISHSIKTLIRDFGANHTVHELDQLPNGHQMEAALVEMGCNPSVPAVFIGKSFIGGSNEVMSLNVKGKLKPLLIKAKAIWM